MWLDDIRALAEARKTSVEDWVLNEVKNGIAHGLCELRWTEKSNSNEDRPPSRNRTTQWRLF
jgi:hypothetical protein